MKDIVGIAGCGRMGAGMLANLRKAGFAARGYDIRPIPDTSPDLTSFCNGLKILFTVVRDTAETDALLFDDQAVVERAADLHTLVISSTLPPSYVTTLQDRVPSRIKLIDAPMSGAQVKAEAGTLTFITGGDIANITPLLQAMGSQVHHMGPFGAGMAAKVLNNMLAASHTAVTRMVLEWADAAGIDEASLLNVIHSASGQNWFASGFDTIEFARDGYAPDNTIGILEKDITAAMDLAPKDNTTLPETIVDMLRTLTQRPKP